MQSIRTQWKQLAKSYPSLKDVIPSFNDPTGTPAFDAESRIEALEKRVSKYNKLQKLKDDLQELLKWFQWARDATIPEARADFSLTSLMEQLQKLEVSTCVADSKGMCRVHTPLLVNHNSMQKKKKKKKKKVCIRCVGADLCLLQWLA